jgi:phage terminase small subunit
MSLNAKQKRFAHEYSMDHNGAQAAIRAGYSARTAKQTASRMMANVAVKQLVAKLDAEKRRELGIEGAAELEQLVSLLAEARVLVPKVWKGQPVTYADPDTGEIKAVTEFRSGTVAMKAVELLLRLAGLDTVRPSTEVFGEMVYRLSLDRDLSEGSE